MDEKEADTVPGAANEPQREQPGNTGDPQMPPTQPHLQGPPWQAYPPAGAPPSQPAYPAYPQPPYSQPVNPQQPPPYPNYAGQGYPPGTPPSQPLYPPYGYPTAPFQAAPYGQVPPGAPVFIAPPSAPRRGLKAWHWVLIGVSSVLVVCCGLGLLASAAGGASTSNQNLSVNATAVATNTPAPTDTPAPTATPTRPPKWTTVHTFKGNGNKKTGNFDVPDDWKLVWSCNPSSDYFGEYNVIVGVYDSDGNPVDFAAVNTICKSGNTHDFTEEHQGGTVYLDVESEGAWTIQVQVLK